MKAAFGIGAVALLFALAGCGGGDMNQTAAENAAPLEQVPAPNNGDWREVVATTPQGGYLLGNPNAPVKLVEYASLACPHCRDFSAEATPPLRDTYVRSGQVSWEFRNYLLNGPDYAFTLLARCQPPAAFFRTVEQMYEQQSDFFRAIDEQESQAIGAMAPDQQIVPLARAMELDTFFARRGMPEARFTQCLGDTAQIQQLTERTQRAGTQEDVQGTPTFFINGTKTDASSWGQLEPLLRTALGR